MPFLHPRPEQVEAVNSLLCSHEINAVVSDLPVDSHVLELLKQEYLCVQQLLGVQEDVTILVGQMEKGDTEKFMTTFLEDSPRLPFVIFSCEAFNSPCSETIKVALAHEIVHAFDFYFNHTARTEFLETEHLIKEGFAEYISQSLHEGSVADYGELFEKRSMIYKKGFEIISELEKGTPIQELFFRDRLSLRAEVAQKLK